jgi:hypothetical protein
MMNWKEFGRISCGLTEVLSLICLEALRKPRKPSVRRAGITAKIQMNHLRNTKIIRNISAEQNAKISNVKTGGTYSNHCANN